MEVANAILQKKNKNKNKIFFLNKHYDLLLGYFFKRFLIPRETKKFSIFFFLSQT